jgi:hypothetical protein
MRTKIFIVALSAIALGFSGCATLVGGGGSQSILLQTSDGKAAQANVTSGSGTQTLTLPMSIIVSRSSKPIIVNVKDTEDTKASAYEQKPKINAWFFGNIITGGLVGSTTDMATGSMWVYDQMVVVPIARK